MSFDFERMRGVYVQNVFDDKMEIGLHDTRDDKELEEKEEDKIFVTVAGPGESVNLYDEFKQTIEDLNIEYEFTGYYVALFYFRL